MARAHLIGLISLIALQPLAVHPVLAQAIEVEEVWRDSGPGISWLAGAVVMDQERTIVGLDGFTRELVEIRWETGERRSFTVPGPSTPDFVGMAPGGIAILSVEQQQVQVLAWGPPLRPLNSFRVPGPLFFPKGLVATPESLVLSAGIAGSNHGVHVISSDGEIVSSAVPNPETAQPLTGRMVAGGALTKSSRGDILFSLADSHLLGTIDPATGDLSVVARDPEIQPSVGDAFLMTDEEGRRRSRWNFPRGGGAVRLSDGSLVHVIRFAEEDRSVWEVYSPDGELLGRVQTQGAYEIWGTTSQDQIVGTVLSDGPRSLPVLLCVSVQGGSVSCEQD